MIQTIHNAYDLPAPQRPATRQAGRLGRQKVAQTFLSAHHFAYDGLDLVAETVVDPQTGASNVLTRSTDALGRPSGFALDDDYAVSYAYDMYGRFHSVASAASATSAVTFTYSYLPGTDLITGMTASSGFLWTRAYESGRSLITSVENRYGESVISRYDYQNDALGRRTSRADSGTVFAAQPTYGNPATAPMPAYNAYSYNIRSEVTGATRRWGVPGASGDLVLGQQYAYDFDSIGNRITAAEGDTSRSASYTANALNQYTQRTAPDEKDLIGTAPTNVAVTVNATAVTRQSAYWHHALEVDNATDAAYPQVAITAVYNPPGTNDPDVVTSQTGHVFVAKTPEQFTYDDDGNLTQDGRLDYTWNGENRLIKAETRDDLPVDVPCVTVEYAYDHQGRMVWKQVSTNAVIVSTRTLIWDGYNIIADARAACTNWFVWGLDLSGSLQGAGGVGGLLAEIQDGVPYFAAYDANGNVTDYLSADGTIAAHYEYSPFGEIVVQSGDMADSFTHRFSTKPWCGVTGLSEYLFRKYGPGMGRWLSRDPLEESVGLALYWFVRNQAVSDCDVLGLCECGDCEIKIKTQGSITAWDAQIVVGFNSTAGINPKELIAEITKLIKGKAINEALKHLAPALMKGTSQLFGSVSAGLSDLKAFWSPQLRFARKTDYDIHHCEGTYGGIGKVFGSCCWKGWKSGSKTTISEWQGPEPTLNLHEQAVLDTKGAVIDDKIRDRFIRDLVDLGLEAARHAESFFDNAYFNERLADQLRGKVGDRKSCKIVP